MNTFSKILILILSIFCIFLWLNRSNNISEKENIIQKLQNSLSKKIDTFTVIRDIAKYKYNQSKKFIIKYDSIYTPGKDSICDSLVIALKNSLNKCDTVINVSDTIIKTLLVRDTLRQEHIQYLKNNNKFSLVVGPGIHATPAGIQPGFGITFGLKIK
jgi:hypothetical protein